ncbi:MAG: Hpt domain-containing protein [Xanthomonadales bacterium]|nr:Hpt domain-containing protein [Xanthomonadales bacterium]
MPTPLIDSNWLNADICSQLQILEQSSPGFLQKLINGFIVRQSRSIADASLMVAHADLEKLRATAHTLKGSAASLGAYVLSQLAGDLEQAARDADLTQCRVLMEAIPSAFDSTERALRQWLDAAPRKPA